MEVGVKYDEPGVELYKEIKTKHGMVYIYIDHNVPIEDTKERIKNYLVQRYGREGRNIE
ncbi:hypothetical protein [Niallia nealsonii]|uniref:hypothetical protein n=1 Tax=Niallia nealsonii TaxID=115979 RepID=UPI0012FF259B|nr:hypothetical protein [Niallia nealsonii]